MQNQINQELFSYTHQNAYQFFQENFSGTIASNISTLADHVFTIIFNISPFILRGVVQLVFALIAMYFVSPLLSI